MACSEVEEIIEKFDSFTQKPTKFLTVQNDVKDDIKKLVKTLYDFTKKQETGEKRKKKGALSKLIIEDFDEEQIWQEIDLQNSECWDHLVWEVANCMSSKNDLTFPVQTSKDLKMSSDEEEVSDDVDSDDNELVEDETNKIHKKPNLKNKENIKKDKVKPTHKKSIVDDQFFKLQEMEQFLLREEKNEGKKDKPSDSDDESIDMFENVDDDHEEEEGQMMYKDFFDQADDGQESDQNGFDQSDNDDETEPSRDQKNEEDISEEHKQEEPKRNKKEKKVKFAGLSSDDDSSSESDSRDMVKEKKGKEEKKSDFELRQERLQQTITRLEEKSLKDAPWQLKGEIDANKRPQNSLLEEVVDFDLTSRPPPVITEQTTVTLEDIIRRRIKDKAWDDVARKEKPADDQLTFRKTEIIDQSKSKLSLAQVYEAEYLKQKQAASGEVEEEKEPESHTEIREAMSKLFSKLDALCNYHYTPKVPQAEVKIVSNIPAISMEEVAPVATSEATLLAPEEVKRKRKGELMSKEERSQTDKNRERRKKKKLQRKKGNVEKVTDHRNTKKGEVASDKSLKTSKAFFQQLNDEATSMIKKRGVKNKGQ